MFEATTSLAERGRPTVQPAPYTHIGPDGRRYSQYALGQSVLALPFFYAGRIARNVLPASWSAAVAGRRMPPKGPVRAGGTPEIAAVTLFSPLVVALLVTACFLLQRRIGVSTRNAVLVGVLIGATSYVAMHASYFLRHGTTTLLLLAALLAFQGYRTSGSPRALFAGGLLAASIPLVRLPDAILGLPLGLFVVWILLEAFRKDGAPALRRALPALGVPLLLAVAFHVGSNQIRWGTSFDTPILSYSGSFNFPILAGLRGFLFSPGASVFAYSPLLLLVPFAGPAFARRDRALFSVCLATSLWLLLFYSKWEYWPGLPTAPGPRYLFAATPLLLVSLGPWLDGVRGRGAWRALAVLSVAGAVAQAGLLLANWHMVIRELQITGAKPPWDWVLVPEKSPIFGAYLAIGVGELNPWLWQVARGWPGADPRPILAACLAGLWLALLAVLVRGLVQRTRAAAS